MHLMPTPICLDGEEIAKDIKRRVKALGRTVKGFCEETEALRYRTYKSWRSRQANPSIARLKKVYAEIERLEAERSGGVCNISA
jgi:hypothetical protein